MRAFRIAVSIVAAGATVGAYPLDGYRRTGIARLRGDLADQGRARRPQLPPGALLTTAGIRLQLTAAGDRWDIAGHDPDPALSKAISSILAGRDPSYGVTVIDITDPTAIAWAGLHENHTQYPGSVGKVLCAVALFDGLRRAFPDVEQRARVLRETSIRAGEWASGDGHEVPRYDPASDRNHHRPIVAGDVFRLAEWLDHMLSPSANAAGAVVWREAMLLRRFGADYPPPAAKARAFLDRTPKAELTRLSQRVIDEPLAAAGLDLDHLQQGTFWTRPSKARIPGLPSFASPRELARLLLRLEQGRLVDRWSSLELKRYLYLTKRRYRYVYSAELAGAAVYFKSGSLYQCLPEPGFRCGKYRGNGKNYMNSIAIIESPARRTPDAEPAPALPAEAEPTATKPTRARRAPRRYIVALMSNVLRRNSAWDHARIGAAIDDAVRRRAAVEIDDRGTPAELESAGRAH